MFPRGFPTKMSYNLKLSTPTPMFQKITILKVAFSFCENKCLIICDRRRVLPQKVSIHFKMNHNFKKASNTKNWRICIALDSEAETSVSMPEVHMKCKKYKNSFYKYTISFYFSCFKNTLIIIIAKNI